MSSAQKQGVKRDRIRIALFAYAYEIAIDPLIVDGEYDELAKRVAKNLHVETGNGELDFWFHENFEAHTGMWVHLHPELDKLEKLYEKTKLHFR